MQSLAGKRILGTRAVHQSVSLTQLIRDKGGEVINFPVIDIQARTLSAVELDYLQQLESYDFVFFISRNAVNFALKLINGKIDRLQGICCVAVGKATKNSLVEYGIQQSLVPVKGFNSEAVLDLNELQNLSDKRCLIFRGLGGRELLAFGLRERGAQVDYMDVYQRVLPQQDVRQVSDYLLNKQLAAILIYSGTALKNLLLLLAEPRVAECLLATPLVVISQRIATLAKQLGFKQIMIATEASDIAMVEALLNGE